MWNSATPLVSRRLIFFSIFLSMAKLARSQSATPGDTTLVNDRKPVLTLAEAQSLAFARNWDLLAANSDVNIAAAQRIIAREFPNPTLLFSLSKINADNHPASSSEGNGFWTRNYDTVMAINQLFEAGGKRASRQSSALAGVQEAEARLRDARRLLNLAITKAYVESLLAEANVQILRASADSLRQEAKIAETRLQAGDISRADKSQIEIAADRLELDSRTAESAAASARIAVEVLMGEKQPQGNWVPGDSLDGLADLLSKASPKEPGTSRPDLVAAQAFQRKADAELKLQKALRIPDPTLLVQYEHEPPDQPNTIGFGVSFPLPLWNRNRGAIAAAKASQDQAALQVGKVKTQIAAEINTAQLVYENALARWKRQRDEIQPKSAEIRKTISFAYEKGGASLLDLLVAERNDNDVRLATAQATADTATAVATLKAALNLSIPDMNRK